MYDNGMVKWPKQFSDGCRQRMPNRPESFFQRTKEAIAGCLYADNSTLRRRGNDGLYDVLIGKGLFSTLTYRKHHKIAEFVGEVIDGNEFEFLKTNNGINRVAYAHPLSEDCSYYLDCYNHHNECKASYANSPFECRIAGSTLYATANCYVKINKQRGTIQLLAKSNVIPPHTELLWEYEESYSYPALVV
jgi:hypothetical protein